MTNHPMLHRTKLRSGPRGFTLVEMVVVVGVLVLILAAVLPMLNKATKTAKRTRAQADLQAISQALESYRTDFRDYPRLSPTLIPPDVSGAELLCWALLAPGPSVPTPKGTGPTGDSGADGQDGLGFRIRGTQGQSYGPYLQPDKFRVKCMDPQASGPELNRDDTCVILDSWDNPIYYCPATPGADPTLNNGYIAKFAGRPAVRPMFDLYYFTEPAAQDFDTTGYQEVGVSPNLKNGDVISPNTIMLLLGDKNKNGMIDAQENPLNVPFLLWSAGPNGRFGIDLNHKTPTQTDDITNFLQ